MSTGSPKIQFRVPQETLDAWSKAAMAAGLGLNGWIRQTLDRGVSGEMKIHTPKKRASAPKKSQKKSGRERSPSARENQATLKPGAGSTPAPATESPFEMPALEEIGKTKPAKSSPFETKRKQRQDWDRQYKRLPLEIRDSWAEENPRP